MLGAGSSVCGVRCASEDRGVRRRAVVDEAALAGGDRLRRAVEVLFAERGVREPGGVRGLTLRDGLGRGGGTRTDSDEGQGEQGAVIMRGAFMGSTLAGSRMRWPADTRVGWRSGPG